MTDPILQRDLAHTWHPCMQMKDFEQFKTIVVSKAQGCYLYDKQGQAIIDAISSWWCKSLGHQHPKIIEALRHQLDLFDQVILANTTNEALIQLCEQLSNLTQHLNKIFFVGGDGSCAIETALKMSIHARQILGQPQKQRFLSLANSYHGETAACLSVSDLGIYKDAYQSLLFETTTIGDIPYVSSRQDPLWHDCGALWPTIEKQLALYAENCTALLVEPLLQGAGGMLVYSQDFLRRLRAWTKAHDIHLIADEIMTGFGRTGSALACQQANIEADFVCLGKGLTAGHFPLSLVLTSDHMYDLFYADYGQGCDFLHSHTYAGNGLGVACALATLAVLEQEKIYPRVVDLESQLFNYFQQLAEQTGRLSNIRCLGGMVAADLVSKAHDPKRLGFKLCQIACKNGALLRPLGNTLYWLPPLTINEETLQQLFTITKKSLLELK